MVLTVLRVLKVLVLKVLTVPVAARFSSTMSARACGAPLVLAPLAL
jgi:hypothetical protein